MKPGDPRPTMPPMAPDLELLRCYAPVVRFTRGEQFFPSDVERYVRGCSLWAHYPNGQAEMLVPEGGLTPVSLAAKLRGLLEAGRPALERMARAARATAITDADRRLADACTDAAERRP